MLGRPGPLWILAVLGTIGGLLCTIVMMQFAEVIPWAGAEGSYIGGRWTGVVLYAVAAGFYFAAAYAWLTIRPWAPMITILAAILGFFVPFIGHMDGTDVRSSAVTPLAVAVLMLFMVFRPSTNRAMAAALAGTSVPKAQKAPPAKPMSAARKRELAEEQKRAKAAPATAQPAPAAAAAGPAPASAAPKPTATAASMVMSAASSLKAAAATPASPRRGPGSGSKPAAPAQPPAAKPAPPPAQRPRGFRADEV